MPLNTCTVSVDNHCEGERWVVQGETYLAKSIALIAIGQEKHAEEIIRNFLPADPVFRDINIFKAARYNLSIKGTTPEAKEKSRYHRDGFLFEAISWIAAQKTIGSGALMKAPHIKSTSQGIDGLILELVEDSVQIKRATICEDKCSQNPRQVFQAQVLPAFKNHHKGERSPELLAEAATLIAMRGIAGTEVIEAAASVLNLSCRRYRAALAVEAKYDSSLNRKALFKGFDVIENINKAQRLAAMFIVDGKLRDYFDLLGQLVVEAINTWEVELSNV